MAKAKRVVLVDAESGRVIRDFDRQKDAEDYIGLSKNWLYTAMKLGRMFRFHGRKCLIFEKSVYEHVKKVNPDMFSDFMKSQKPIATNAYLEKSVADVCLNCTRKECTSECGCRAYTNAIRAVRYGIA